MRDQDTLVWRSKRLRDSRCGEKDAITRGIIGKMKGGSGFRAILMPCLHGIEVGILSGLGVKPGGIFAIERVDKNWRDMKKMGRVTLTPRPMDAHVAVDYIEAAAPGGFDLIYGDFLGQPDFTHAEFLYKIFALGMIRPGGKLLLTFGLNRCRKLTKEFNDMLIRIGKTDFVPTRHYVEAAVELAGHRKPRRIREHPYQSSAGNSVLHYVATEVDF
jgi:hypothetical protein